MTTVERYRSAPFETLSNAPSNARRTHSSPTTIARTSIPPAVPSPPRPSERHSPPHTTHIPKNLTPTFNMSSEEPSQWLFTDAELAYTPSVLDGLPITEERCRRAKGVNFITQAGILLKLPQLTLATASVFFHRFYMRYSMIPEKGGLHHYVSFPPPCSHSNPFQRPSAASLQIVRESCSQGSLSTVTNRGTEHRRNRPLPRNENRRKLP
jgi:protein BUR2